MRSRRSQLQMHPNELVSCPIRTRENRSENASNEFDRRPFVRFLPCPLVLAKEKVSLFACTEPLSRLKERAAIIPYHCLSRSFCCLTAALDWLKVRSFATFSFPSFFIHFFSSLSPLLSSPTLTLLKQSPWSPTPLSVTLCPAALSQNLTLPSVTPCLAAPSPSPTLLSATPCPVAPSLNRTLLSATPCPVAPSRRLKVDFSLAARALVSLRLSLLDRRTTLTLHIDPGFSLSRPAPASRPLHYSFLPHLGISQSFLICVTLLFELIWAVTVDF